MKKKLNGLYLDNYKIDCFHCFYGSPIQIIIGLLLLQRIYINWIYTPWISKIRKRKDTISMIFLNSYTLQFFKYKIVLFCLFGWLVALAFLIAGGGGGFSQSFSHIYNFNCFQQKCILRFSFYLNNYSDSFYCDDNFVGFFSIKNIKCNIDLVSTFAFT